MQRSAGQACWLECYPLYIRHRTAERPGISSCKFCSSTLGWSSSSYLTAHPLHNDFGLQQLAALICIDILFHSSNCASQAWTKTKNDPRDWDSVHGLLHNSSPELSTAFHPSFESQRNVLVTEQSDAASDAVLLPGAFLYWSQSAALRLSRILWNTLSIALPCKGCEPGIPRIASTSCSWQRSYTHSSAIIAQKVLCAVATSFWSLSVWAQHCRHVPSSAVTWAYMC